MEVFKGKYTFQTLESLTEGGWSTATVWAGSMVTSSTSHVPTVSDYKAVRYPSTQVSVG